MTNKTFPDFADASSLTAAYTTLVWNGSANKEATLSVVADWAKKRFSYQLSPTVAANNLTLALLTSEGNTPTAAEPIYIQIGNTIRTVSAATTCVLAAGTSWFNAGSVEHGTKELDYFAYAVWDSNSSVVAIAQSRIPSGRLVSDFSATTTNEKHLGNYANFTSTDDVANIGRFAATLSLVGTGHLWSVPTFTGSNLIHATCNETRWLTYAAQVTSSTGTITTLGTITSTYQVSGLNFHFVHALAVTTNGTGAGTFRATLPFTAASNPIYSGRENNASGLQLQIFITGNLATYTTYNNLYPAADGYNVLGSGAEVRV